MLTTVLLSAINLDCRAHKIVLIQLSSDIGEFKHKSSYGGSARCFPSEINVTETSHVQPLVMAEWDGFDAAGAVLVDSQKTSIPWPRENKTPSNIESCHVSSMVSGLPIQHKYCLNNLTSSLKNPPTVKSCSDMSDFSYQLVRSAERSASTKMDLTSANSSLSEKMSLLHQPRYGGNHQNQKRISALNRRHKVVNSRGTNDLLNTEKFHDQPDSSLGKHSQVLLNNALVREKQLCCSDLLNQKATEELWSPAYSESEKIVCFSSGDSIDDLQVSSSSDTSDSSNLSSLGVVANDQWKMTFKKVYTEIYHY